MIDCNASELACASSILVFAIDSNGICHGIMKQSGGTLTIEDYEMALKTAMTSAKEKLPQLESFFSSKNPIFVNDLFPDQMLTRLGYLA